MRKTLHIKSPAKVNLFLEVLGKRSDHYHEIVTVMQEITLFDEMEITEQRRGITIRTNRPDLPTDRRNLVYRAAELLKKCYGIKQGVKINLAKRIPIGGGLGGGSSNTAYTLKGLNQLWKLGLSNEELSRLAGQLGSDVPFFIYGGTALCKGRGEIVFPLDSSPDFRYVIVYPGFSVPTKEIYQNLQKLPLTKPVFNAILAQCQRGGFNRLETTALKRYPRLRRIKKELQTYGLKKVLLCGSGASLFAVIQDRKEGDKIKCYVRTRGITPPENVFQARTVNKVSNKGEPLWKSRKLKFN